MLVLDALGEIRLTHSMDLIGEILDSGTNAIGVTLCDPKTYGETAYDEALQAILAYDRHIDAHPDRLVKATTQFLAQILDPGHIDVDRRNRVI